MTSRPGTVCVFCGSNVGADPRYREAATALGKLLAQRQIGIVYGGGRVGLMGVVADSALEAGGQVVGVIPEAIAEREVAHHGLTDLIVVGSMHARKAMMAERADAFVALPGGLGTFEELLEVADSALEAGGQVVGVIPEAIAEREVAHHGLTDLIVVGSMHARKGHGSRCRPAIADDHGRVRICTHAAPQRPTPGEPQWSGNPCRQPLPAGLRDGKHGSASERARCPRRQVHGLLGFVGHGGARGRANARILTWSQLGIHQKPVGLLNVAGYYDPLLALIDRAITDRFMPADHRGLLIDAAEPEALLNAVESRELPSPPRKWVDLSKT